MSPQTDTPNNAEINQALNEFEAKAGGEHPIQKIITPQTNQLSTKQEEGVSFDTDKEVEKYTAIKFYKETAEPKMVKAVMKYSKGVVKDQRQAEWILLGFVVVAIGTSLYLFFGTANSNSLQSRNTPLGQPIIRQVNNL